MPFPVGEEEDALAVVEAGSVALGNSGVYAEGLAEAGLGRLCASHCNDSTVVAAVLVEAVNRLSEENLVEDSEASCVAGANSEHYEVLRFLTDIDDLDILAFKSEFSKIFSLREEEILSAADSVELLCKSHAALILFVLSLAVLAVSGDIKSLLCCDSVKESAEL